MRINRAAVGQALLAIRQWGLGTWVAAASAAGLVAVAVGVPTVVIPNPWFSRDVPVQPWNIPVLILTAVLAGMLMATYIRRAPRPVTPDRPARLGVAGTLLGWFAVGCPVCNKLALLALGYTGALTWFAPVQPFLGVLALSLSGWALVARLAGQGACAVGTSSDGRALVD